MGMHRAQTAIGNRLSPHEPAGLKAAAAAGRYTLFPRVDWTTTRNSRLATRFFRGVPND